MKQSIRPVGALLRIALLAACAAGAAADPGSVEMDERQWAMATNGDDLPWADADQHCRELELDGHRDWRLPALAELETLHDPQAEGGITEPIALDTCCLWSSTTVAERPAEHGGAPGGDPEHYFWGFLFEGGTRYYSFQRFSDGRALCVRDVD
ncbi:MAG: DUF1566 domain-containing protein [Gammaproteobacteria bacterium]|nr:DUF1566 domain-containing protein [Gammaproteobacteria bacterium]